ATKKLRDEGFEAEVIDLRTLKPLDEKAVLSSVKKTGRLVIVEESHKIMGFADDVSALVSEQAILSLKGPIVRVAGYDIRFPLFKLEDQYLPDPRRVMLAAKEVMSY
ncbi:MAG TPA: transketolase C-terminal domain-containing protein, partial [Methanocella sp.]|nr:transketolase C-terminal domain-containing protein [Methanocella sp.]